MRERIAAVLAAEPAANAIQFKGRWTTWGQLGRLIADLEATFDAEGLGPGAAIGGVLRNDPRHAALMLAVVPGGRCLVPFNALLPDGRLAEDVRKLKPPVVVVTDADWRRPGLREAAADVGALGLVLTDDPESPLRPEPGLARRHDADHDPGSPDVAVLMLTSGTTGAPKRVPLRREVLERQVREGRLLRDASKDSLLAADTAVLHSSFVHIGGVWSILGLGLAGRKTCLLERFTVNEWHGAVLEHRPRSGGAPPSALRMILEANLPREDLSSLQYMSSGTAPLDPAIADAFLERYNIPILQNYGATEFGGGVASWSLPLFRKYWRTHRGATGRLHRGIEARVVDPETGAALAAGEEGVLELRGFAMGDGCDWVRTADRAKIDAQHFLWIRGRADNAINRGGFKIQPDDVARVLEDHPSVREASVVGIRHARLGEAPAAALVLRHGADVPTTEELTRWAKSRLLSYQTPIAFKIVEELPRTPSFKVSTPAVRDLFADLVL